MRAAVFAIAVASLWLLPPMLALAQPAPGPPAQPLAPATPLAAEAESNARSPKRKRRLARTPPADGFRVASKLQGGGGALLGYRERTDDMGFAAIEADLDPGYRLGPLELELPIDLAHRQTFGGDLPQSSAAGALAAKYRLSRALRVGAEIGVGGVRREDWPDLYQPIAGGLAATDRYSYWERRAGAELTVHPARSHWIRAGYGYRLRDYVADPAFDAAARPNHLTPFDYDRHGLDLDYHYSRGALRVGAGAEGFLKQSFFVFARDAHVGATHAGPRGAPPNPLQELRGLSPRVELQLELWDERLELEARYMHELQEDTYQGYYSFSGPRPSLGVRARPLPALELTARAELLWRRYGASSYRVGLGHPPLDSGDRRFDRRLELTFGAHFELTDGFALTLDAGQRVRDTNFPDYEPAVFPASQLYAIDWDYSDTRIEVGLEAACEWR